MATPHHSRPSIPAWEILGRFPEELGMLYPRGHTELDITEQHTHTHRLVFNLREKSLQLCPAHLYPF